MSMLIAHSISVSSSSSTSPELKLYTENQNAPTPPAALGRNSIALGSGAQTAATAANSLAIGDQSLARITGGIVQASGRFGSSGDAQAGRYLVRAYTGTSSLTEALVDGPGGSDRLVLADDSTWTFTATITAHQVNGNGHAGYVAQGVIYRGAGVATTAIQGAVIKTVISESDSDWDIDITSDITNGSLCLKVTGQMGKLIRWVGLIETVEVTN